MAWTIDGFSPAEIARELDVDPATARQSLAKARPRPGRTSNNNSESPAGGMDDNEAYDPTWRDDAELDALLLAAKMAGLADLDGALDIPKDTAPFSQRI